MHVHSVFICQAFNFIFFVLLLIIHIVVWSLFKFIWYSCPPFFLLAVCQTLVDLPGLTKVTVGIFSYEHTSTWMDFCMLSIHLVYVWFPTQRSLTLSEGQPKSIVQDTENMVRSYVEKVLKVQLCSCWSLMKSQWIMLGLSSFTDGISLKL